MKDLIVEKRAADIAFGDARPEDYLFSSARSYAELDNYIDVEILPHKPLVQNWK